MLEKWKTKGGCIVEIDALSSNGRLKSGCAIENGNATRCLWDAKTGQCWGPERWDLIEEIKENV